MSESRTTQPDSDSAPPIPPRIDWADPDVPAGNAPPLPRWPLVVSAVVFGLWIVFLIAMAVIRLRTTPV